MWSKLSEKKKAQQQQNNHNFIAIKINDMSQRIFNSHCYLINEKQAFSSTIE